MITDKPPYTIFFTIEYQGNAHRVSSYPNQYYSLMTLISDLLAMPQFGICSGMGSCGTCMVSITHSFANVPQVMLACGVGVNDELAGAVVVVEER